MGGRRPPARRATACGSASPTPQSWCVRGQTPGPGKDSTRLRDARGPIFDDGEFAGWFAAEGRSGVAPALLALVCLLQATKI
jgi:hypothetical protein